MIKTEKRYERCTITQEARQLVAAARRSSIDVNLFSSSVMEVARRLVWRCLVDDPVLFFRTILEQLTKKDKQVSLDSSLSLVDCVLSFPLQNFVSK